MAIVFWRGQSSAVAQVTSATPANVETGDRFHLTINGKRASYTAQAATAADVAQGLAAAVTASGHLEFQELAAVANAGVLTLTAKTPGQPFTVTSSTENGGAANTQTLALATVTPSSGPKHWDTPANWSGGALPATGDEVILEHAADVICHGLEQASVTLARLSIAASFTGELGLPRLHATGTGAYAEYRPRFLRIGATLVSLGRGRGEGSPRLQLDTGAVATTLALLRSAAPLDEHLPAVLWQGTHAGNVVHVQGGSLGIALAEAATAQVANLYHAGGDVLCGAGLTLGNVERTGQGRLVLENGAASVVQSDGETRLLGGGLATLLLTGGTLQVRSSGALGNVTLDGPHATLDFSSDSQPRTVAACTLKRGQILDPHGAAVWTTGLQPTAGVQAVG